MGAETSNKVPSGLFLTFVLATCILKSRALARMWAMGLGKGIRAGVCRLQVKVEAEVGGE